MSDFSPQGGNERYGIYDDVEVFDYWQKKMFPGARLR